MYRTLKLDHIDPNSTIKNARSIIQVLLSRQPTQLATVICHLNPPLSRLCIRAVRSAFQILGSLSIEFR